MDKKIFYGEYTLLHWIELILKHNIILPDYQRGICLAKGKCGKHCEFIQGRVFCTTSGNRGLQERTYHKEHNP